MGHLLSAGKTNLYASSFILHWNFCPAFMISLNVPFDHHIFEYITIYDQLNVPFHTQALVASTVT